MKKIVNKLVICLITTGLLVTTLDLAILEASMFDDKVVTEESETFVVISDTEVLDKRDGYIYGFETNEAMVNYMESSSDDIGVLSVNEWRMIDFTWLNKQEVKDLADDVRSAQQAGNWTTVAGAWLYAFPPAAATVITVGVLMSTHDQAIINAANNDQSITIYHEQRVNWDGYGRRTRTRVEAFD